MADEDHDWDLMGTQTILATGEQHLLYRCTECKMWANDTYVAEADARQS
jgi:hypothetical protein